MKGVSIVIPVYGQWDLVKLNVEKNFQYDGDLITEVILVDDCSPELNPHHFNDKVRIIRNKENLGYSGTVNVGLRAATSEIIVLFDSDAHPVSSYIQLLIKIYKEDSVGCVGFKTIDENNKDTGNFDFEPTLFGFIVGQKLHAKLKRFEFFNHNRILPFSCAVSFRKKCLEEMGYFDEKEFPVLDADNDVSMRIHRSRWKLLFENKIEIFHKGGNSIPRNHKRVLIFHRSRWKLLKKHKLIKWYRLAKLLTMSRICMEIVVLKVQRLFKNSNVQLEDKLNGRLTLLQEVKHY